MNKTRIAAAHLATPTCNASVDHPFHRHSLACRTKAVRGPVLKVVR